MVLLFRGPDAVRHLKDDVIGSFTDAPVGDSIRGTFGDFIRDEDGSIRHFEPAVITAPNASLAPSHLRLLAEAADRDGGILTDRVQYDTPENIQTTLVILKPEDFELRSRRPGNVIDMISRTGLKIVGARLLPMTVSMASQLYGPLKDQFVTGLKGHIAQQVYARLQDAFPFPVTMCDAEVVSDLLADRNAAAEFNRIVRYMTGVDPDEVANGSTDDTTGRTRCLALLYQGPDAIEKVRTALAGVNPIKAVAGNYQSEFAQNLVRNGAHASESVAAAERDRAVVGLSDAGPECTVFKQTIDTYLRTLAEDG
jgi:nucleoside diphosphate kinase